MPMPERLRAWIEQDGNHRILIALMEGVAAGLRGQALGAAAGALGYTARSAQGDAFETGYEFGREKSAQDMENQ